MILLLLALVAPNLSLTPGFVRPLTVQQVCSTKWGKDARHVSIGMKQQIAMAYGVRWENHALYEFDHLVPRELGGADSVLNIWPQKWPEARKKDKEENRLHKQVCAGKISLEAAQQQMQRWGR